jgi:hypothetical protein
MAFADENLPASHRQHLGDEDANDHIDSDTPRSGVATPRPDPSDKRLPGIMHSYFQVGLGFGSSSESSASVPPQTPAWGTEAENPIPFHRREEIQDDIPLSAARSSDDDEKDSDDEEFSPLLPHEQIGPSESFSQTLEHITNPYPTPPVSKPPSRQQLRVNDLTVEDERSIDETPLPSYYLDKNISNSIHLSTRERSTMNPLSSIVTTSSVHANHFSNPSGCSKIPTLIHSHTTSALIGTSVSYDQLKRLTQDAMRPREKSHPPTPTRALSNNTATSDTSAKSEEATDGLKKKSETSAPPPSSVESVERGERAESSTSGAPVKAPRGKLTVKILEARNLRRSKDPYVVAVFQRNELVSKGPRSEDTDDEDEEATKSPTSGISAMGGIPISRQGSDSGRSMAIPMKSRQSSSTSLTDYRDFKMKTRKSMTNPKWDTEAVL